MWEFPRLQSAVSAATFIQAEGGHPATLLPSTIKSAGCLNATFRRAWL